MATPKNTAKKIPIKKLAVKISAKKEKAVKDELTSSDGKKISAVKKQKSSTAKDRVATSAISRKAKKQSAEKTTVKLPTNMSIRSIEKSAVLLQEFERYFGGAVYRIAYVAGLCFIVVGATYATVGLVEPGTLQKALVAESFDLGGIDTTLTDQPRITNTVSSAPLAPSEFKFLTTIPENIIEPTEVIFEVTNADDPKPKLVVLDKVGFVDLLAEKISDQKYRVTIPFESLKQNYYELRVYVKPTDGSTMYVRRSSKFFVGTKEAEKLFNGQVADWYPTVDSSKETEESIQGIITITNNTEARQPVEQPPADSTRFEITSPASVLTGVATINLLIPENSGFGELYARPVNALSARFIALATKRFDRWIFVFDSKNIPNGEYEFFAQTKINDQKFLSKSVRLTVSNGITSAPEDIDSPLLSDQTGDRELITINSQPYTPEVTFDERVAAETTSLVTAYQDDLNSLFTNYASAKQAGDESLIKAAKDALDARREAIIIDVHREDRLRDISDTINEDLANRIIDLQNRIDTFEDLRAQRSSGTTATDTDNDGISDVDEKMLYGTNPNLTDTDGDGIADGVEIMRGYNPNDATVEAIIRFESPKNTVGLTRYDTLQITDVVPVISDIAVDSSATIATEIHGKGLPNSFVTIYVFSSPTVVTVRTDADGSFVYTYDKELEDGQHDVFATVTDNAGAIIAQSNPFSFIKEAQAFTPIAAAEGSVVSPVLIEQSTGGRYDLAIAVSILGFGLVLLMLGMSLRGKGGKDEVIITEAPVIPVGDAVSIGK